MSIGKKVAMECPFNFLCGREQPGITTLGARAPPVVSAWPGTSLVHWAAFQRPLLAGWTGCPRLQVLGVCSRWLPVQEVREAAPRRVGALRPQTAYIHEGSASVPFPCGMKRWNKIAKQDVQTLSPFPVAVSLWLGNSDRNLPRSLHVSFASML